MFVFTPKNPHVSFYAATIGFFDGVHRGHRFLLRQVADEAVRRGLGSMAITFRQHPRRTLQSDWQPHLLSTPSEKRTAILACGIQRCEMLDFTLDMAHLTSEEFMRIYLKEQLSVRVLVIGYDHHFGSDVASTFADYQREGARLGIEVVEAQRFSEGEVTVSSSVIRRYLQEGNARQAAACLGRPYALSGHVVSGFQIGRTIGFPTANLVPDSSELLVPARGVYAVFAETEGGTRYPAMLNIGLRPTLGDNHATTIEVHLLGFKGDLYGTRLTLHFIERLRDEQAFPCLEALTGQLQADAANASALLSSDFSRF